jgi:hypothetical protein
MTYGTTESVPVRYAYSTTPTACRAFDFVDGIAPVVPTGDCEPHPANRATAVQKTVVRHIENRFTEYILRKIAARPEAR